MKLMLVLVLTVLGILVLWTYRRRIDFAFKGGAIAYVVLLVVNIVRYSEDEASLNSFLIIGAGAAVLWGSAWLFVTIIDRRRHGRSK